MKSKSLYILLCVFIPLASMSQSSTTESLRKKHTGAMELFFYNNTLRMLNQSGDKELDDIIKDIEKMRFVLIKKSESNFNANDYKKLLSDYKAEAFEEIMTSRHEGKNFDVYLKDSNGKAKGMLVLINDDANLYVLDILGSIELSKVTKLYNTLDQNTDVSGKIRQFIGDGKDEDNKH